jgi:hypothetical protein
VSTHPRPASADPMSRTDAAAFGATGGPSDPVTTRWAGALPHPATSSAVAAARSHPCRRDVVCAPNPVTGARS